MKMAMATGVAGIVTACMCAGVMAQDGSGERERSSQPTNWSRVTPWSHGGMRGGMQGDHFGKPEGQIEEGLVNKIIRSPEAGTRLGLTEAQIKTLKDKFLDLKKEEVKVKAEMELAAIEQAKLMTEDNATEAAMMESVEKTGNIRTKLAKLRMKQILLVKQTLTPEQLKKVKETMKSRTSSRSEQADKDVASEQDERKAGDQQQMRPRIMEQKRRIKKSSDVSAKPGEGAESKSE